MCIAEKTKSVFFNQKKSSEFYLSGMRFRVRKTQGAHGENHRIIFALKLPPPPPELVTHLFNVSYETILHAGSALFAGRREDGRGVVLTPAAWKNNAGAGYFRRILPTLVLFATAALLLVSSMSATEAPLAIGAREDNPVWAGSRELDGTDWNKADRPPHANKGVATEFIALNPNDGASGKRAIIAVPESAPHGLLGGAAVLFGAVAWRRRHPFAQDSNKG